MPLEDMSEEDMVTVTKARRVAVAFGDALFETVIKQIRLERVAAWEAFADELCEFVDLVEN